MDSSGKKTNHLQKLSSLNAWALSLGCIVGWGAFILPGTTFLSSAGPVGSIIGIIIGCILFVILSRAEAYMITQIPSNGGIFNYVNKVLGRGHAFLSAWVLCFSYISMLWLNTSNIALFCRYIFGDIFLWGFHYQIGGYDIFFGEILLGMVAIAIFSFLLCYGKKYTLIIQNILAISLVVSIVALLLGTIVVTPEFSQVFKPAFVPEKPKLIQIYHILLFAPWMFIGFESISMSSGDFGFPVKKINWIMPLAVVMGGLSYCILNVIASATIPPDYHSNAEYIQNLGNLEGIESFPVLYSAYNHFGHAGVVLLGIAVLSALATSMIGVPKALARLIKSMADEKLLPGRFSELNKDGVPQNAVLLIMFFIFFVLFLGRTTASWFTDALSINATLVFMYTSVCCYICAKKEGNEIKRKLGIVGIVISLALFLLPLLTSMFLGSIFATESYFILAVWGIAAYIITVYISD